MRAEGLSHGSDVVSRSACRVDISGLYYGRGIFFCRLFEFVISLEIMQISFRA